MKNAPEKDELEVPLKLGVGDRQIGIAKIVNDEIVIAEISDPEVRKQLQGDMSGFSFAPNESSERI